jgi:hypothetical protein
MRLTIMNTSVGLAHKWMLMFLAGMLSASVAFLVIGSSRATTDTLEAKEFVVLGKGGRPVARLSANILLAKNGTETPGLAIYDEEGREAFLLVGGPGGATLVLQQGAGRNTLVDHTGDMKVGGDALVLGVDREHGPYASAAADGHSLLSMGIHDSVARLVMEGAGGARMILGNTGSKVPDNTSFGYGISLEMHNTPFLHLGLNEERMPTMDIRAGDGKSFQAP